MGNDRLPMIYDLLQSTVFEVQRHSKEIVSESDFISSERRFHGSFWAVTHLRSPGKDLN